MISHQFFNSKLSDTIFQYFNIQLTNNNHLAILATLEVILFPWVCFLPFLILNITLFKSSSPKLQRITHRISSLLVAFSVGTFLSEAFVHSLPVIFNSQSHEHHHHDTHNNNHHHHHDFPQGRWIIYGIIVFYALQRIVDLFAHDIAELGHDNTHQHDDDCHHQDKHSHSHNKPSNQDKHNHNHQPTSSTTTMYHIAFLTLFSDIIHNIGDGIQISTSYLTSPSVGRNTTVLILLHEFVRVGADISILSKSGVSLTTAFILQLLTSFGTLAGCLSVHYAIDLFTVMNAGQNIEAFNALLLGCLLYISFSLLNSIKDGHHNHNHDEHVNVSTKTTTTSIYQYLSFIIVNLITIAFDVSFLLMGVFASDLIDMF